MTHGDPSRESRDVTDHVIYHLVQFYFKSGVICFKHQIVTIQKDVSSIWILSIGKDFDLDTILVILLIIINRDGISGRLVWILKYLSHCIPDKTDFWARQAVYYNVRENDWKGEKWSDRNGFLMEKTWTGTWLTGPYYSFGPKIRTNKSNLRPVNHE